jgi:hypothetical protein
VTIHSPNEYGLTFLVVEMSESQCSILLRAKLVGSRCYGYRYPVKVKTTLILAAVKRSYLKALDIVSAQAESQEEGPIMLGTDPLAANKESGDSCVTAVRGKDGYDYAYCPRNCGRSRGDRRWRSLWPKRTHRRLARGARGGCGPLSP